MSAPSDSDEAPMEEPGRSGFASKTAQAVAAVVAIGVLVLGAKAIAGHDTNTATAGTPPFAGAQGPQGVFGGGGRAVPRGALPYGDGGRFGRHGFDGRGGMPPGFGSPISGATLARLKSVVTAKYPGTIERAFQLPDGSYVVHVIGTNGEVHVHVTKDFELDGADDGFPGGPPGGFGGGGQAPSGPTSKS